MTGIRAIVVAAVVAGVAVAAVALAGGGDDTKSAPRATVIVGEARVLAEVAADPVSQQRGLSGRERLAENEGMLFLLANDSPSFWMKGMRFPLDVLWINDGRVVDVTANVPPPSGEDAPLPTYSPDRPANRALEVNAGWAARHGIARGDRVRVRSAP
jgi:uncharacterized protein